MTEKKPVRKKSKPISAINFSVWAVNGGPLDEEVVTKIEASLEASIFELFNEGHRLLTQTNKA